MSDEVKASRKSASAMDLASKYRTSQATFPSVYLVLRDLVASIVALGTLLHFAFLRLRPRSSQNLEFYPKRFLK
jgi:hypothetical protein